MNILNILKSHNKSAITAKNRLRFLANNINIINKNIISKLKLDLINVIEKRMKIDKSQINIKFYKKEKDSNIIKFDIFIYK